MSSSAPRLPVLVLLTAGSVAIGFLAGRTQPESVAPSPNEIVAEVPSTSAAVATLGATDAAGDETRAGLSLNAFRERLNEIATNDRFGIRRFQYKQLIDSMTAEELRLLLAELQKDRSKNDRDILMHFLFRRWGEVAGESAVSIAMSLKKRERARYTASAMGGWARVDPEAAWQRTIVLAENWPSFAIRATQVMSTLVRNDLGDAISRRDDIPSSNGKRAIQRAIIEYAAEDGRLGDVLAEVKLFESLEDQKSWVQRIFTSWGQGESEAPLAALSEISDSALAASAMGGFLSGWAQADPMGAVDYALDNRDEPLIADNLSNVLRQALVGGDRERALELVVRIADIGELDDLAPPLMPQLGSSSPRLALEIAGALSDKEKEVQYTVMALSEWAERDFISAVDYFEQIPNSKAKQMAMRSLGNRALRREDGGRFLNRWVQEIPAGEDKTNTLEGFLARASSPNFTPSDSSKQALRALIQEIPRLSESARRNAEKLFGSAVLNDSVIVSP